MLSPVLVHPCVEGTETFVTDGLGTGVGVGVGSGWEQADRSQVPIRTMGSQLNRKEGVLVAAARAGGLGSLFQTPFIRASCRTAGSLDVPPCA